VFMVMFRVALFSTHNLFFVCVYGDVFMLMFKVVLFVCVYDVCIDKFVWNA
jgi:hypothetical protein